MTAPPPKFRRGIIDPVLTSMRPCPPRKVRKRFLKMGFKSIYFAQSALKMQEIPFQKPKFQKMFWGECPRTPLKFAERTDLS